MDKLMLEGDETPSDDMPTSHRNYMGLDEADDEVFEEEADPSKSFHSRYDHAHPNSRPVELKVRKEISDTGYKGYIAPVLTEPPPGDPTVEEILHKVVPCCYSNNTLSRKFYFFSNQRLF